MATKQEKQPHLKVVNPSESNLANEAKFRGLIENSIQGVMIQRDRKILFTNQAYAEMRGFNSPEELVGVDVLDLTDPSEHPVMKDRQRRRSRGEDVETNFEALARRRDGSRLWVDCVVSRVDWDGEPATQVTNVDITARKEAEAELALYRAELESRVEARTRDLVGKNRELMRLRDEVLEAHEKLEELNEQKNRFFSIIAHDLKNPFNVMLNYSKLFAEEANRYDPELVASRGVDLYRSAVQVFDLLENLLEWSQLQMGSVQYKPEAVAIEKVFRQNHALFLPQADEKQISLHLEKGCDCVVSADQHMLATVVRNLLSNAIKFTPHSGTITLGCKRAGEDAEIFVRDSGVGMTADQLAHLFRLDATYSSTGTDGETGTGLGLHICRELVEIQGGRLRAESKPGEGSVFVVTLPAQDDQAHEPG